MTRVCLRAESSLGPKHGLDRFQVAVAVFLLRFEDAAFGPFVPGVDGDDLGGGWGGQETVLYDLASLAERGGRVADHDRVDDVRGGFVPLGVGVRTGGVVPVDRGVGEIRHRVVGDRGFVELQINVAALDVVGNREGA